MKYNYKSVLQCMMHSYDSFHKDIRQVMPSPRFSVVTALCLLCIFAQLTSFTMLRSLPSTESLHHCPHTLHHLLMSVSKGGDIIGLCTHASLVAPVLHIVG